MSCERLYEGCCRVGCTCPKSLQPPSLLCWAEQRGLHRAVDFSSRIGQGGEDLTVVPESWMDRLAGLKKCQHGDRGILAPTELENPPLPRRREWT